VNLHPIEFTLTNRLLKTAQEFIPLEPLPRGESVIWEMDNPAFVSELLSLFRGTSQQWIPEVLKALDRYMREAATYPLYMFDHPSVKKWRTPWANWINSLRTIHLPIIVSAPSGLFVEDAEVQRAAGIPPQFVQNVLGVAAQWNQQLAHILRSRLMGPHAKYYNPRIKQVMDFLFNPDLHGLTRGTPVLDPYGEPSHRGQPAELWLPEREPREVFLKAVPEWSRVLTHELGHALVPYAGSGVFPPEVAGGPDYSGEFTNMMALREIVPTIAQRLLKKYPSPSLAKVLGYWAGGTLGDYEGYLGQWVSLVEDLLRKHGLGIVRSSATRLSDAARLPVEFLVPQSKVPFWDEYRQEFLRAFELAKAGQPVPAPPENLIQTALSLVLAAPELQEAGIDVRNVSPVEHLQALQRMKQHPERKQMFEVALGKSIPEADLAQMIKSVEQQVPEVRDLVSRELIREHLPRAPRK